MLPVFGVGVSVTFRLMCVHIIFSWFELLGGSLLGGGCSLGWPCVHFVFWLFVVLGVSRYGFGAGFGFWLLRFLIFA